MKKLLLAAALAVVSFAIPQTASATGFGAFQAFNQRQVILRRAPVRTIARNLAVRQRVVVPVQRIRVQRVIAAPLVVPVRQRVVVRQPVVAIHQAINLPNPVILRQKVLQQQGCLNCLEFFSY